MPPPLDWSPVTGAEGQDAISAVHESAHWELRPRELRPYGDGYTVALAWQGTDPSRIDEGWLNLGWSSSEEAAKRAAQQYEDAHAKGGSPLAEPLTAH
jgi:hypothetical protein